LFRVYRNRCGSEPYRLIAETMLSYAPNDNPGGEFTFQVKYVGRLLVSAMNEDEALAKVEARGFHLSAVLEEDDMLLSELDLDDDPVLVAFDGVGVQ
jgi:hypothetical protein